MTLEHLESLSRTTELQDFKADIMPRYPVDLDPSLRTFKFIDERERFLHKVWTFVSSTKTHSEILKPGNYEYPFEYVLPGDSPESVEGLRNSHVIYRLKATIDRGLLASNMYARKHLRVIRTFDTASPDVSYEMVTLPRSDPPFALVLTTART